jgi:hypothetical protein
VEDMNGSYWSRRFDGARRVLGGAPNEEIKAAATAATRSGD